MIFSYPKSFNVQPWLIPTYGTLLFLIHPIGVLLSRLKMLGDPGIGWHLKAGHYMLQTQAILNHDLFSYTRQGEAWLTYEWLFQCLVAWLEHMGGLPLVTVVFSLIFSCLPILIYRRMLLEGVNIYLAIGFTLLANLVLASHAHARPHVFTYLFFALLLERLILFDQKMASPRTLFLFIPLMVIWSNLHGGFIAGLALVGLFFAVAFSQYLSSHSQWDFERSKTYFAIGSGMFVASLINPFGWHLHIAIVKILNLNSIHKMSEFMSPDFNSGIISIKIFEIILLATILIIGLKKRGTNWVEIILIIFFLNQALHAMRHIFLFVIIANPFLAREISLIISGRNNWFIKHSQKTTNEQEKLKSSRIWIPAVCVIIIVSSQSVPSIYRHDLYDINLTKGAGTYIKSHIDQFNRMFNTENLGGALTYHFWPDLHIFADDRNDFYGDDFYQNEYFEVLFVKPKWKEVLEKYEVSSAVLYNNQALLSLFEASDDWYLVFEDKKNFIFLRHN